MRHVIVGNGPAGVAAARTLRQIAPADEVVVLSEEAQPFYSKVLTSYVVGGKVSYENMLLATEEEFERLGIKLMTGKQVVRIDPAAKTLTVSSGERVGYDRLLIAAGASPAIPPVDGARLPGVFTLWTHDDTVALRAWIRDGQRAVIVGAGLVGLKAAEAFLLRGLSVTVVELLDRVLPQVLLKEDAALVEKALKAKGLAVRTGTAVGQIAGDGKVEWVILTDGTALPCDVVVIATGVRPNLAATKAAGVSVGRGILVDDFMRTTMPGIYAAGDVAEGWDVARGRPLPNPTWGNASEQGRVAAYNMAGLAKPYSGAVSMNTFTFLGFSMGAVGITQPEGDLVRVETYSDPARGHYRKLITSGDRLVGGIAIGDVRMLGVWRNLIAQKAVVGAGAQSLLRRTNYARAHGVA